MRIRHLNVKNKLKKNIAICTSISLAILCFYNNVQIKAGASEKNNTNIQVQTDAPNLINNYAEDSMLCDKLKYDMKNNTTDLKNDVEEELNKAGVFDEEINDLDNETINELNKSINTKVYINYVSVDEINNGTVKKLNNNDIDDIIEERIEEDKLYYEEDKSLVEKIENALNSISVHAEAAEPLYEDWSHPKTKNKVKQTIYACQFEKKGKIYVTAKAYWLEEAYYKNIDVFGVTVKNGNIIKNTAKCTHTANYISYSSYYKNGEYKEKLVTHPDAFKNKVDAIACKVNLFGDRTKINAAIQANVYDYYKDEYIELKFQCRYENTYVIFATSYNHAATNKNISPSISFSNSGISVGVSGSSSDYYSELSYNAYMDYKHI